MDQLLKKLQATTCTFYSVTISRFCAFMQVCHSTANLFFKSTRMHCCKKKICSSFHIDELEGVPGMGQLEG